MLSSPFFASHFHAQYRSAARAVALAFILIPLAGMRSNADTVAGEAALTIAEARTEYQLDPIGIDAPHPRLSWQLASHARDVEQSAYQIQVATSAEQLASAKVLWDSGRVASAQSLWVPYAGPELKSGQRYFWRVRTWDQAGNESPWSTPAFWEMGLLQPRDWVAQWITPAWQEDTAQSNPSPMLRKEFAVAAPIRRARLHITSLGLYEAQLNGKRVGDALLTPGWTSYNRRLQYQTYDVTEALKSGANAIGVTLGSGWYRGPLTWDQKRNEYGEHLALLAQLEIEYADGRTQTVASDGTWKAWREGPILLSEIYAGEHYDARREMPGWSSAPFDDHAWAGVKVIDHKTDSLVAPVGPPVRAVEEIKPIAILHTPAGETVVDLGQNMVGHVRLRVRGPAGAKVVLRHAEVLDRTGNFYTANLRGAAQTIEYTLKGSTDAEVFEPHFTFQGFRYVAVSGYPGELTTDSLTGIVVHSDLRPTGEWASSNPRLNQLQHNIVWGQKGNFVDVPTDCPQRDERLGWTGDAQAFARTAAFNFDVAPFFAKWLRDVAADQKPDGKVPVVIPNVLAPGDWSEGSSGWADVATIAPWTMYLVYGDVGLLRTQYPSMKAWVEYERSQAKDDIWKTGFHFGDWLSYATTDPAYPGATTGKDLIATAFYAHSADLLARTAAVLGYADDARVYAELFERIKRAFNHEFVTPAGRVGEATQTAYVLALQFGLLPEALRAQAAQRLADDVAHFNNHLTTGFLGTPYLCRVLSDHDQLKTAYALLNQDTYPSWLYPITKGATTIWERWDGMRPDGTFQDVGMNSFNHYAYGAIGDWMYSVVAGIDLDPREPGYRRVLVQPQPGGGLTWVRASIATQFGRAASAWKIDGATFSLNVTVPPNTHATVRLPNVASTDAVSESGHPLKSGAGVKAVSSVDGAVVVELGSGEYAFAYPWRGAGP